MNLLRVIPSMNPERGGPCQGIRNSIPELTKLGINNEVVCLDNPQSSYLEKDTFKIHAIGQAKSSWMYNSTLEKWLESNLKRFDVVIVHGMWLYHSYITMKMIRRERQTNKDAPKVFLMPHGMLDPWFQREKTRKLKALRNEIYWRVIEKEVVASADALLFTCEQELLLARETFKGYAPRKEVNVGYGIQPPPVFSQKMENAFRKTVSSLKEKSYLLFLSRIHPKKGIDLLVDAYINLETKNLLLPHLVIAGPIDSEYALAIKERAQKSSNIHFSGMLQGDAKWGAFYGCQAFILPSHQENFGISVAEALACGKPVLISDQVNIYREIEAGGGGLISEDTHEGVLGLLSKWLSLDEERKEVMSKNAEKIYLKNYSIDQAALELKQVLEL